MPALIVFSTDAKGVLTLTAGEGLAAIGSEPGASIGKTVYDLAPDNHELIAAIESALHGNHVTLLVKVNGRTLLATFVPAVDDRGRVTGLIGAAYDTAEERGKPPCADRLYVIRSTPDDFGHILDARDTTGQRTDVIGKRCFEEFHGNDAACTNCPALGQQSIVPVTRVLQKSHKEEYRVVTAEWKASDRVELRARGISDMLLSDLIRARIEQMVGNARLSDREREVFELMLLGRPPADIAQVLGIKERTAKFHQANVLSKLGAESRYDLQRLVLQAETAPTTQDGG